MKLRDLEAAEARFFARILRHRGRPVPPGMFERLAATRRSWREITRRAVVATVFDEEIYAKVLAPDMGEPFSLRHFVDRGSAEPLSQMPGFFRCLAAPAPAERNQGLRQQLAEEWRQRVSRGADAIWLLPHLIVGPAEEFKGTLSDLLDQALDRGRLDLDRAEQVLGILEPLRGLMSKPIAAAYLDEVTRVSARKLFAQDHYRSERYHQRPGLHERLRDFARGDAWLLPVFAAGGMGKTMLLRRVLTRDWLPERFLAARIDFDHVGYDYLAKAPWLLLLPLCEQLAVQLPRHRFDRFFEFRNAWSKYLLPSREASASKPSILPLESPAPGSSEWASLFADHARAFAEGLPAARQMMVILDTTEEPYLHGEEPFTAVLELLETVRQCGKDLRVVVAGRYDLFAKQAATGLERVPGLAASFQRGRAESLEIQGFTLAETEAVLAETCGPRPPSHEIAEIVFKKSKDRSDRALPFDVALWARELRDHPLWTAKEVRAQDLDIQQLVERVLERIPDDDVRWLVRYSALLRRVTFPLVQALVMPEVRRNRPPAAGNAPRRDHANEGTGKKVFGTGTVTAKDDRSAWDRLRIYASGPEEGWISPDPRQDGGFVLHPRVVTPMRRLVEKQIVWGDFHATAQRWFEARAGRSGTSDWCEAMCEALFHAFQRGAEFGQASWQKLIGELPPSAWEAAGTLAAVVLGEAGFEIDEAEVRPLFNLARERRVPVAVEKAAAEVGLRAALWHFALEDEPSRQLDARKAAALKARRWQATHPPALHPLHAAFKATQELSPEEFPKVASQVTRLVRSAPGGDALLLQLLLARLQEANGRPDAALASFGAAATLGPRERATAPVDKRRLAIIHARAMARLGQTPTETAQAFEVLAAKFAADEEEAVALRLAAARAWQAAGRPKRVLKILADDGIAGDSMPMSVAQAHLLRAEAFLSLRLLPPAAHSLRAVRAAFGRKDQWETLGLRISWGTLQGRLHSQRLECKEACEVWYGVWTDALDRNLTQGAWEACLALARHKLMVESDVKETTVLLGTLESISAGMPSQGAADHRLDRNMALSVLKLELSKRVGTTMREAEVSEAIEKLKEAAAKHSDPISRASAVAAMVAWGEREAAELAPALEAIHPASARVRALAGLASAPTARGASLPGNVSILFRGAFPDRRLDPGGGDPAALRVADYYRVWGRLDAARKQISAVAHAALEERNLCLWREASHAADRLLFPLERPALRRGRRTALEWMLLLERSERELNGTTDGLASPMRRRVRLAVRQLLKPNGKESLANTGFTPRVLEVAARLLTLSDHHLKQSYWVEAADLWQDLGESSRAQHCRAEAARDLDQARDHSTGSARNVPVSSRQETGKPKESSASVAEFGFDELPRVDFKKSSVRFTWRGESMEIPLPPTVGELFAENVFGSLMRQLLGRWTDASLESMETVLQGLAAAVKALGATGALGVAAAENLALTLIPWELASARMGMEVFRTGPSAENQIRIGQWLQRAARVIRAGEQPLLQDGIVGRLTRQALADLGVDVSRNARKVIEAVRRCLDRSPSTPPLDKGQVLLIDGYESSPSNARDAKIYQEQGIRAEYLREKNMGGATRAIASSRHALLHIRCRITDINDSGQITLQTRLPLRIDQLIGLLTKASAAAANRLRSSPVGLQRWPALLLDVQEEGGNDYEMKRAILRRNRFCDAVWNSGIVSSIIASCEESEFNSSSREKRVRLIAEQAGRYASQSEISRGLRDIRWGKFAPSTALWTHHPELPFYWPY